METPVSKTRKARPDPRLSTVDILRGLAAAAVTWFHFTAGHPGFLPDGWLRASGTYGWAGVEVFFVISGFIIPFALSRADYRVRDYGRFLLKRIIRLEPPYLVSIAAIVVGAYLALVFPTLLGHTDQPTWLTVLLHIGYLNWYVGSPMLNPVFWTLAVEVQFYLFIGLAWPLVSSRSNLVRLGMVVVATGLGWLVETEKSLVHWLPLFLPGILAFQKQAGLLDTPAYLGWTLLAAIGAVVTHDWPVGSLAVVTALLLALARFPDLKVLTWLGAVSYSLYLVHVPVGGRVLNLGERMTTTFGGKLVFLAAAVAASLVAAWALHVFVERPAQRWSSGIRYRVDAHQTRP